jgi:hypothetical protein
MQTTLANVFGSICAWLGGLIALLAGLCGCLTVVCIFMMLLDHGLVDHYWSCGVAIYGFGFIVLSAVTLPCFLFANVLLKDKWWRLPKRQIGTIVGYLLHRT